MAEPTLREITFEDFAGCQDLEQRVGFPPTPRDYWEQLWRNPTPSVGGKRLVAGWVLVSEGTILGHFGNIPMPFAWGGETLMTAAARGVCVDRTLRGHGQGARLAERFFHQADVDLVASTTTNAIAGRLFLKIGAAPIPQSGYDIGLYWILDPKGFARAALRRLGLAGAAASAAARAVAPLLTLDLAVRGGRIPQGLAGGEAVEVRPVDEFGPEFDDFFARKRSESRRLLAFRTAQFLNWHFDRPSSRRAGTLLCCRSAGRLSGYAVTRRLEVENLGLVRSNIVDLVAERDDPKIIDALLAAAHRRASATGCHVLEMIGFPLEVRRRVVAARARSRRFNSWPYFYRVGNAHLADALRDANAWYACPFDGDGSL